MKFVFFLTLFINITFFLWEYRKGAPDIYLPPAYKYSENDAQKIVLLSIPPEILKQSIKIADTGLGQPVVRPENQASTDVEGAFVGPVYQQSDVIQEQELVGPVVEQSTNLSDPRINSEKQQLEADAVLETSGESPHIKTVKDINNVPEPFIACYQLNQTATEKEFISSGDIEQTYTLAFTEEDVPYISNYLVLTLPVETIQQAKIRQETLKQEGISDLWMFKKGKFKWRISLGLFSSPEKAEFAKEQYTRQTTESLDVVPSWQMQTVTQLTISTLQKKQISGFEKKFSYLLAKEVDCF